MKEHQVLSEIPLVLRIEDIMLLLSIGRNSAYQLVHSGRLESIRVGTQNRIPRQALLRFLGELV